MAISWVGAWNLSTNPRFFFANVSFRETPAPPHRDKSVPGPGCDESQGCCAYDLFSVFGRKQKKLTDNQDQSRPQGLQHVAAALWWKSHLSQICCELTVMSKHLEMVTACHCFLLWACNWRHWAFAAPNRPWKSKTTTPCHSNSWEASPCFPLRLWRRRAAPSDFQTLSSPQWIAPCYTKRQLIPPSASPRAEYAWGVCCPQSERWTVLGKTCADAHSKRSRRPIWPILNLHRVSRDSWLPLSPVAQTCVKYGHLSSLAPLKDLVGVDFILKHLAESFGERVSTPS